jgi:hypothetical protein
MGAVVGSPVRGSVRGIDSPVRGSTVVAGADGGAGVSTGADGEPTEGIGEEGVVWASAGVATSRTVPTAKVSGRGHLMGTLLCAPRLVVSKPGARDSPGDVELTARAQGTA